MQLAKLKVNLDILYSADQNLRYTDHPFIENHRTLSLTAKTGNTVIVLSWECFMFHQDFCRLVTPRLPDGPQI
jgi:hypothetical protein